ncbi:endonuclease/exonuclease/phosphatase family protein [Aquihabitans sp. G128]|uniref:endonuclease/exonuclease/phosphatase family protein n=1 Tax=Aquihabitans sp. G128 TaxID=2849779 RepID=UPI001C21700F|nr:endonuclease/exonuclease/phosphatase family protein [Aquihabitans sp. G128]QXC61163.1 endonuclease/exonuclease/phosphatase family protein [Aquihabitans sp. G128]
MGTGSVRVGFWNTWLLRPRVWPSGPVLPVIGEKLAPHVGERAPLVGAALRDRFDVVALGECFEQPERDAVAAAWPGATLVPGPARGRFRLTGSGLATLVDPAKVTLVHQATHAYRSGGDLRDSDTFATKGALLTRVQLGDGEGAPMLDLVSTHLIAGGDLLPVPGAEDSVRHHGARMRQVDELVSFIERERRPDVPVLLVGDFNVQRRNASLADPSGDYDDLAVRLRRIGLEDLWAAHGVGPGHTCTFASPTDLPPDPDEPDQVADDPDGDVDAAPGERIDYLWLAPAQDHSVTVDVERPRRWAFSGRGVRGGPAGSLSDHLALSVTLHLS